MGDSDEAWIAIRVWSRERGAGEGLGDKCWGGINKLVSTAGGSPLAGGEKLVQGEGP